MNRIDRFYQLSLLIIQNKQNSGEGLRKLLPSHLREQDSVDKMIVNTRAKKFFYRLVQQQEKHRLFRLQLCSTMGHSIFVGLRMPITWLREDLVHAGNTVFGLVSKVVLDVSIDQAHPLTEIAEVHNAFETGETTGSTLLIP